MLLCLACERCIYLCVVCLCGICVVSLCVNGIHVIYGMFVVLVHVWCFMSGVYVLSVWRVWYMCGLCLVYVWSCGMPVCVVFV